ncbi:MAG: hypothetical protein VX127_16440, partial [Myxococcota bacterium]|nr:hypothetical protein [Myxococcota bacterium]
MKVVVWFAWALWCVPAWAQDEQQAATESEAPAPVDESTDGPSDAEDAGSADANRTAVEVVLQNGIVLTGTVRTADAVSWSAGKPLRFTPDQGEAMELEADKIQAVRTPAAKPAPAMVPRVLESP